MRKRKIKIPKKPVLILALLAEYHRPRPNQSNHSASITVLYKMNPPPNHQVDVQYELQKLSRALSTKKDDTLSDDGPPTVIDNPSSLHDNFLRNSRDSSEAPSKGLESTYHVPPKIPKTSLEVLECAHQRPDISVRYNLSTHSGNGPLQTPSPISLIEEPSNFPLPPTPSDIVPSTHPSSIAFPSSLSVQNDSTESEPSIPSFSGFCDSYSKKSTRLSKYFPHLRCVCSGSRHDKANITIFDYTGSVLRDSQHLSIDFRTDDSASPQRPARSKIDECHHFIYPADTVPLFDTRLVVVEDLGQTLIDLLGATFNLSPEFFEEHLHRSNYLGPSSHGPSPLTWRTSNLQKDYVSLAWLRPGESWKSELGPAQRNRLLGHRTAGADISIRSKDLRGRLYYTNINFEAKTNIFRERCEISTDPGGRLPDRTHCGLEERATVCKVELNGIQYGAYRNLFERPHIYNVNLPIP